MTPYQIDDITQLYYDARKDDDNSQFKDPDNAYFAPTSPNWTQRNAATELAHKDDNRIRKQFFFKWSRVAMLFKHVLSESASSIIKMVPEFQGHAVEKNLAREIRFYVWNFALSQWDRIGTGSIDATSDTDWMDDILSGFSDYVDGSKTCYFMAYVYEATDGIDFPPKGLYADYWRLVVEGPGRPFYLGGGV
jgi:hypothetical protein